MKLYTNALDCNNQFDLLYGIKSLNDVNRYNKIIRTFNKCFKQEGCYLCSASGRIEIIGNHTDHNGGSVIGATINKDIVAGFLPRKDNKVIIKSDGFRDIKFDLRDISKKEKNSRGLVKGVLFRIKQLGYKIGGFSAYTNSTVKNGAGMSSSASFEIMVATIINCLYNSCKIDAERIAKIAQFSENEYFGKPCGLLDQGTIAIGGMVHMDFSDDFHYKKIESKLDNLSFVVIDTGKSHSKLIGEYAKIPSDMRAVAKHFGKQRLIDVSEKEFFADIKNVQKRVGQRQVLRAKHFFTENKRVFETVCAIDSGNNEEFIKLLNESGNSSKYDLQNCALPNDRKYLELIEFLESINKDGATRVHGGGFGGTILCVVKNSHLQGFLQLAQKKFKAEQIHQIRLRSVGALVL